MMIAFHSEPKPKMSQEVIDSVYDTIFEIYSLTESDLKEKCREAYMIRIKQMIAGFFLERDYSLNEVGKLTNNTHATVINRQKKFRNFMEIERMYIMEFKKFKSTMYNNLTKNLG